jgi:hypothetical protein
MPGPIQLGLFCICSSISAALLLGDILHEPEVGPLGVDPIDAARTQSVHQPRGITIIGELYIRCLSKVVVMNTSFFSS